MNQKDITHITAVTEVKGDGQKCTEIIIEYRKEMDSSSIDPGTYDVKQRTITEVKCEGKKVKISLDENNPAAYTWQPGNPWKGIGASVKKTFTEVVQKKDVKAADGEVLSKTEEYMKPDQTRDNRTDRFIQAEFGKQKYNLYIPNGYQNGEKYPLVQFIHDAGGCGSDTKLTLVQGEGALVWTDPEVQKKHPCFVFAPQFDGPPIVDDDWNVDARLEESKAALDHIVETYPVDKDRIYTTGQSMGCMSSIVLNVRYPEYFAASYLVAGQWDERAIPGLEKQKLWMLCSQGDAKAFPIMNQMCVHMEQEGAKVVRKVMEAGLPEEEYCKIAEDIEKEDPDIIFTPYKLETVANGWHSNGGEHHMSTWTTAYEIEAVREWLFRQKKEKKSKLVDFSSRHEILIHHKDGSYTPMDEPYYEVTQLDESTWQIMSSGDYHYLVAGDEEGIAIDTGYGAGNLREFLEKLCGKPVRQVINTHSHFDHSANNCYFEKAYMGAGAEDKVSIPYNSFTGMDFFRDSYEKIIVGNGDRIPLKGRELEIFEIGDHTADGIAILDRKHKLLFSGDEFMPGGKGFNSTVEKWNRKLENLDANRAAFDQLCGGPCILPASEFDLFKEALRGILEGKESEEKPSGKPPMPGEQPLHDGHRVYDCQMPHIEDIPKNGFDGVKNENIFVYKTRIFRYEDQC